MDNTISNATTAVCLAIISDAVEQATGETPNETIVANSFNKAIEQSEGK